MDMGRFFFKKQFLSQKGQSSVEYIMLMAIIISLVSVFFKSDLFQSYFGDDGTVARVFKGRLEYTYTHAISGTEFFNSPNFTRHDSYVGGQGTRFFGAKNVYPAR